MRRNTEPFPLHGDRCASAGAPIQKKSSSSFSGKRLAGPQTASRAGLASAAASLIRTSSNSSLELWSVAGQLQVYGYRRAYPSRRCNPRRGMLRLRTSLVCAEFHRDLPRSGPHDFNKVAAFSRNPQIELIGKTEDAYSSAPAVDNSTTTYVRAGAMGNSIVAESRTLSRRPRRLSGGRLRIAACVSSAKVMHAEH